MQQTIVPSGQMHYRSTKRSRLSAVGKSREIYDNAMSVYSWDGAKTDDTDVAIDLMLELEKHPMVRFDD
jgi:hypothetical protein